MNYGNSSFNNKGNGPQQGSSREPGDRDRKDRGEKKRSRSRERDKERDRRDKDREKDRERKDKKSTSPQAPPRRKPKRASLWDIAPSGFETGSTPQVAPQMAMNPHQNRQARRLYVGNIPASVSDVEIAEFFNTAMFTAGVTKNSNPATVVAVQMNREKSFAFIEFSCADDASAGMAFDGITLQGHALKVRRPKDYKTVTEEPSPPPSAPDLHLVLVLVLTSRT